MATRASTASRLAKKKWAGDRNHDGEGLKRVKKNNIFLLCAVKKINTFDGPRRVSFLRLINTSLFHP